MSTQENASPRHDGQEVQKAKDLAPSHVHPGLFSWLPEDDGRSHRLFRVTLLPQARKRQEKWNDQAQPMLAIIPAIQQDLRASSQL